MEQAPQRCLSMTDAWFARRAERVTLANRTDLPVAVYGRQGRFCWSASLWLGILAFLVQGGRCDAQTDQKLLAESVLSYRFHTAPLAPIYLSEYSITVEPSRSVRLWYRFGPGSPGAGTTHTFQLNHQQYRQLVDTLAAERVLGGDWTSSATLIGASQQTVTIREPSGKAVTITSTLQQGPRERFTTVVDAMRTTVPMAAWIAKDRDQQAYQSNAR